MKKEVLDMLKVTAKRVLIGTAVLLGMGVVIYFFPELDLTMRISGFLLSTIGIGKILNG